MMPEKDPNTWWSGTFLMSLLIAAFGRLSWLGENRRRGRRIWSLNLLFEIPTAILMVWIGQGIGEHFSLGEVTTNGLIGALAYLGPKGLLEKIQRHLRKENAKESENKQ